jgi:serine/threonine-protein kinase RsbW
MTQGYQVGLSLRLPQDRLSPPIVRHLTRDALDELGVVEEVIRDIELAISEACANVLDHAGSNDAYDVSVTIRPDRCELRVVDVGRGIDHDTVEVDMADPDRDGGRGLALMDTLMDHVRLDSEPERGTLVLLVKRLAFREEAPARRLLANEGQW